MHEMIYGLGRACIKGALAVASHFQDTILLLWLVNSIAVLLNSLVACCALCCITLARF